MQKNKQWRRNEGGIEMSLAANYVFVKEALAKQGKNVDDEIERVLREGRQRTKASAVGYLMTQLEVERVQSDVKGWWIGKVVDIFKREKTYVFEKESNKLHEIKNYDKTYKAFTPISLTKIDKCKNVRTNASWIEATDMTQAHLEDKLNIEELMKAMTPFDDVIDNDHYLVTGTIKRIQAAPIFGPDGGKPIASKPLYEKTEKGDKLNLKVTLSNSLNEDINVTIGKFQHLVAAYPEEPPADFPKWFLNAKDEERLDEITMALQGANIIALGRGSKYMEKDGEKTVLKRPYLTVAEDGILINVEQFEKSGGQMRVSEAMPEMSAPVAPTPTVTVPPTRATPVSTPAPAVKPTTAPPKDDFIKNAIIESIKAGKGGKEDLIIELPKKLGVESPKVIDAIRTLVAECKIFKETLTAGNVVYKSTDDLPG